MLFRYKIEKHYDIICSDLTLTHYEVKIQKYSPNNIFFKWTTCKITTLKDIVELLGEEYCFANWDNALREILETISRYGNIDKMMAEYIHKIIIRDMELADMMDDLEKSIDDIVLTNDWKTIEFKENK